MSDRHLVVSMATGKSERVPFKIRDKERKEKDEKYFKNKVDKKSKKRKKVLTKLGITEEEWKDLQ